METRDLLRDIENLADFIDQSSNKKLDDETIICECFCVNVSDIRKQTTKTIDLKVLKESFGLGTGCQSCVKDIDSWKDKI